jgi:NADH:ubiquinone oxidoreductase subunit K
MIFVACAVVAGSGFVALLMRKTFLGFLLGLQLLGLAVSLAFVVAGVLSGVQLTGAVFGWILSIAQVAVWVAAFALIGRFYLLRGTSALEEAGELKQ